MELLILNKYNLKNGLYYQISKKDLKISYSEYGYLITTTPALNKFN
jgi:hypothetical protein